MAKTYTTRACSLELAIESAFRDAADEIPGRVTTQRGTVLALRADWKGQSGLWYEVDVEVESEVGCDRCGVRLEADTCPSCGVYHGDPCGCCRRRGYHEEGCRETEG